MPCVATGKPATAANSRLVEAGVLAQVAVTELAAFFGEAEGRRSADEITLFDSTGLAIKDLAIARAAPKAGDLDVSRLAL